MSGNMKTALLAAISVVVAIALIFAGTLLGAAIPGLDSAAQRMRAVTEGLPLRAEAGASSMSSCKKRSFRSWNRPSSSR